MGKDLKGKELGVGISQRKDGLYTARFTNRFGKRISPIYAKTEREIKRLYREEKYKDEHGLSSSDANMTLNMWFDEWLSLVGNQRLKESTVEGYTHYFNAQIRPYLGSMKLVKITPMIIQKWLVDRKKAGLASVDCYLSALKTVLRDAVVLGILPVNPAQSIVGIKKEVKKTASLTKWQIQYLLDNFECKSDRVDWKLVVRFLVLTGYRFGEMAGLNVSDIDWNQNVIHVRRTLHVPHQSGKSAYFTTPKTPQSKRDTPMTLELRTIILEAIQLQVMWQSKFPQHWKTRDPISEGLLFTTRFGKPISNSVMNKALKRITEQLNVGLPPDKQFPKVTAHCFRDTFASLGYEVGVPIKEMQSLLGHSDASMTLYYTSVSQQKVAQSQEALHRALKI